MREYLVTESQLRGLARGNDCAEAVALLTDAQLSRRRLMLLAAADRAGTTSPDLRAPLALVAAVDRAAPGAGRDLLRHPFLETWFAGLTSLGDAESAAYLGALAAVAAVRAGLPFHLDLTVSGASLVLPGLGTANHAGPGRLALRFDGSTLEVVGGDGTRTTVPAPFTAAAEGWRPAFRVRLPGATIEVDDADPLRDRFPQRPLDRLPRAELAEFGRTLEAAWKLLAAEQSEQVAGMSVVLREVVPLLRPADGNQVSASGRACFGAVGISPTDDPEEMAELLLHESRHQILDALLDLVDLCRPEGPARHHAPWRPDPRPAEALLQGVYAFAGVADFWRVRRHRRAGPAARRADFAFQYWREQVEYAVTRLLEADELTAVGRIFFAEVASVVRGWREESASREVARRAAIAVQIGWRLSHHQVDPARIETLRQAWLRGAPAVPVGCPSIVDGPSAGTRLSEQVKQSWLAGEPPPADLTPREQAIVRGEIVRAVRQPETPRSADDWVALAVALTLAHPDGDSIAYHRPEVLRAVSEAIAKGGRAADAATLARWFDGPS